LPVLNLKPNMDEPAQKKPQTYFINVS
jgi:hypothetical protein